NNNKNNAVEQPLQQQQPERKHENQEQNDSKNAVPDVNNNSAAAAAASVPPSLPPPISAPVPISAEQEIKNAIDHIEQQRQRQVEELKNNWRMEIDYPVEYQHRANTWQFIPYKFTAARIRWETVAAKYLRQYQTARNNNNADEAAIALRNLILLPRNVL